MKSRPCTSSDSVQFANSSVFVVKGKSRPGTFAGSIADLMPSLLGVHSRTLAQSALLAPDPGWWNRLPQSALVRISNGEGSKLSAIYIALTDAEARELRDALNELLETTEAGWHVHVMDERFWEADAAKQVENEVTVYRADDETMA